MTNYIRMPFAPSTTKPLQAPFSNCQAPFWPPSNNYQASCGHYRATTKPPLATSKHPFATTKPHFATTTPPLAITKSLPIPFLATTKPCLATTNPARVGRASLLVLSGQWQDMPARECLTESGRLEALATYATQLPKRCIHHQTHFEHFQALLERPMHSLYI